MSRIENILRAIIDNTPYTEEPQSRVEEILLAIKNDTQYSGLLQSRIEEILSAIKNNTSYDKLPMSRIEEILIAKLKELDYTKLPQSRIEELLIEWLVSDAYEEIECLPPILFSSNGGSLNNYRIYGNTISGESVGDKTSNLFDDNQSLNASIGSISIEPLIYGFPGVIGGNRKTYFLPVTPGEQYTISTSTTGDRLTICGYYNIVNPNEYTTGNRLLDDVIILPQTENIPSTYTFTVPNNVVMVGIYYSLNTEPVQLQIEKGSTATPYEPYGYKVPVKIEGKNLAKNNHADSSTLFTVEEVNNFIHVSGTNNSGSTKAYIISKENTFPAGSYDIVNTSDTTIGYDYKDENNATVYDTVSANSIKTFNFPAVFTRHLNIYKGVLNGESIDNYFQIMVVRHGTDTSTYEPYHVPITSNLYLPEQIKKVGSEYEYIDYAEQKQYFADGTSVSVALPTISTLVGTNTLDIGTNVIPSSVSIYGKIKSEMTTYMESITPDASIGKVIFVTKSYIPQSGQNLYAGILARTIAEGAEFDGVLDSSHYDYLRGTSDPEMKRYKCTWRKTYVQGEKYYARAYLKYLDENNKQIECYGNIYSADINGYCEW